MKKIMIFVLLCGLTTGIQAQTNKHEINAGVGIFSTSEIIDIFADILTTGITGGAYNADKSYTGSFHLGYKYRFTDRVSAGGTLLYEHATADAMINNVKEGDFKNNYYTLAAEMDYRYLNKGNVTLYGTLGAGATLYTQKYTSNEGEKDSNNAVHFNFQITPIGIKYGSRFGVFAEAGFGYKGILSAGLFARF